MALSIERELLRHRTLLWSFVKRELRARYVGSVMGLVWSIIHPLTMLLIYTFVFSVILRARPVRVYEGSETVNYAIFLCCGLIPWNCVLEAMLSACNTIVANGSLIKRVKFPASILPAQSVATSYVTFAISMALFLVFLVCLPASETVDAATGAVQVAPRPFPGWMLLALPVVMAFQFACMIGPAYLLATINVFFRDTSQIVNIVFQLMFWGTPIIYRREDLIEKLPLAAVWFQLNPLTHLVEIYRYVLIRHDGPLPPFPWGGTLYLLALGAISYAAGRTLFKRSQPQFADEV